MIIRFYSALARLIRFHRFSRSFQVDFLKMNTIDGWMSKEALYALYSLCKCLDGGDVVVEIGSYKGRSTSALSLANSGVTIHAIDPHTGDINQVELGMKVDTFSDFRETITKLDLKNVKAVRSTSFEASKRWDGQNIDLLFIDGWHEYEAVQIDIDAWSRYLKPQATVVFDDYSRPEVMRAIMSRSHKLPPKIGSFGQLLVFSNDRRVKASRIGRWMWRDRIFRFNR